MPTRTAKLGARIIEDPASVKKRPLMILRSDLIMLLPNETYSKEYQLRCIEPGTIRLPQDEISYRDVRGNEYKTSRNALEIYVQREKMTNQTDAALNKTGIVDAQNETSKDNTQTEKGDVEIDHADVKTDDADAKTEVNSENYLSALLITIVLLLSAAFSRYL